MGHITLPSEHQSVRRTGFSAMKASNDILFRAVPAAMACLAAGLLVYVGRAGLPDERVPIRVPVAGDGGTDAADRVSPLEERTLEVLGELAEEAPGSWAGFRGDHGDAISGEAVRLADRWGEDGPGVLWSVDLGEGYAGAAVRHGRVYVMDYDREKGADALRCFSLADGRELWRFSYPVPVKRNHGMSRTVPVVTDDRVVAIGPKCQVSCLDALTGEFRWGVDMVLQYGTTVPPWYAGQCPVVDNGRVILAPAGEEVLMTALDLESGDPVWETPNPKGWKMTHVSVLPVEISGKRTYVYCGHRGVAGVAADDGTLLWQSTSWKISIATVATPVPLPGDRLLFSGGYKAGSMTMRVETNGGDWGTAEEFRLSDDVFGATQQTPLFHEGFIYGVRPNGELVCLTPEGEIRWTSGLDHRFGLGPFIVADGRIFVMDDHGTLTMARATPDRFEVLAEAKVLDGHDSWGPMAIAGGRLLVRDLTRMVCVDLKAK